MFEEMPRTPFSTPLSGSVKETEIRIRNIMSGPKKRPPLPFLILVFSLCIFCGNIVSCQMAETEQTAPDISQPDSSSSVQPDGPAQASNPGLSRTPDWNRNGISESFVLVEEADGALILAVFDASRELDAGDLALLDKLTGRLAIGILNKCDLGEKRADRAAVARHTCALVELSAKTGTGVQELEQAIQETVGTGNLDPAAGMVANQRQLDCVLKAARSLDEALSALGWGETLDAVSVVIEEALQALMELTGQRASQEIIDQVFESFCVGK